MYRTFSPSSPAHAPLIADEQFAHAQVLSTSHIQAVVSHGERQGCFTAPKRFTELVMALESPVFTGNHVSPEQFVMNLHMLVSLRLGATTQLAVIEGLDELSQAKKTARVQYNCDDYTISADDYIELVLRYLVGAMTVLSNDPSTASIVDIQANMSLNLVAGIKLIQAERAKASEYSATAILKTVRKIADGMMASFAQEVADYTGMSAAQAHYDILWARDMAYLISNMSPKLIVTRQQISEEFVYHVTEQYAYDDAPEMADDVAMRLRQCHGAWIDNFLHENSRALAEHPATAAVMDMPRPRNAARGHLLVRGVAESHDNARNFHHLDVEGRQAIASPIGIDSAAIRVREAEKEIRQALESALEADLAVYLDKYGQSLAVAFDNPTFIHHYSFLYDTHLSPAWYERIPGIKTLFGVNNNDRMVQEKRQAMANIRKDSRYIQLLQDKMADCATQWHMRESGRFEMAAADLAFGRRFSNRDPQGNIDAHKKTVLHIRDTNNAYNNKRVMSRRTIHERRDAIELAQQDALSQVQATRLAIQNLEWDDAELGQVVASLQRIEAQLQTQNYFFPLNGLWFHRHIERDIQRVENYFADNPAIRDAIFPSSDPMLLAPIVSTIKSAVQLKQEMAQSLFGLLTDIALESKHWLLHDILARFFNFLGNPGGEGPSLSGPRLGQSRRAWQAQIAWRYTIGVAFRSIGAVFNALDAFIDMGVQLITATLKGIKAPLTNLGIFFSTIGQLAAVPEQSTRKWKSWGQKLAGAYHYTLGAVFRFAGWTCQKLDYPIKYTWGLFIDGITHLDFSWAKSKQRLDAATIAQEFNYRQGEGQAVAQNHINRQISCYEAEIAGSKIRSCKSGFDRAQLQMLYNKAVKLEAFLVHKYGYNQGFDVFTIYRHFRQGSHPHQITRQSGPAAQKMGEMGDVYYRGQRFGELTLEELEKMLSKERKKSFKPRGAQSQETFPTTREAGIRNLNRASDRTPDVPVPPRHYYVRAARSARSEQVSSNTCYHDYIAGRSEARSVGVKVQP